MKKSTIAPSFEMTTKQSFGLKQMSDDMKAIPLKKAVTMETNPINYDKGTLGKMGTSKPWKPMGRK